MGEDIYFKRTSGQGTVLVVMTAKQSEPEAKHFPLNDVKV
jgi:hypothetical protein